VPGFLRDEHLLAARQVEAVGARRQKRLPAADPREVHSPGVLAEQPHLYDKVRLRLLDAEAVPRLVWARSDEVRLDAPRAVRIDFAQ
jgi:hypothetical protein